MLKRKTKDKIHEITNQKRKEFIDKIDARLKPLGFEKKGNAWKKYLSGEAYLTFEADESSDSDEYFFNVSISIENLNFEKECFCDEVILEEMRPFDWRLYPEDEFSTFLENDVVSLLSHIINTPLVELGKEKKIWEGCACERDVCENCWVEKSFWEVDKDEEPATENSKHKKLYWLPPEGFADFFLRDSDDKYKAKHPIQYWFIVALGLTALVGPMILYYVILRTMGISTGESVGLEVLGLFIIGIGLFNFVSIILDQYLGHLVSIVMFLLGGGLVIVGLI